MSDRLATLRRVFASKNATVFLLGLLLGVVLIVAFRPGLPELRQSQNQGDRWELPGPRKSGDDEALKRVMQSSLWLTAAQPAGVVAAVAPEEKPLTPPDWRISGTFAQAGQLVALLSTTGQPDRQLRVGDQLPGGAKILAISPDRISILLGGKRRYISTYQE
ncbi:type II secretion system protein N [Paucibacter sp. APW11]|uniref:Type II secretion system protein N n=1 Tax=Roseateles aquae TaxID=3077235 RepID=A0ABU3PFD1_9BURK|nr:type II secretion system protein N [Paucibacter sp. APW11]MDT9001253.1 type II secretion system protein N [Paucibacter sp. APW11]